MRTPNSNLSVPNYLRTDYDAMECELEFLARRERLAEEIEQELIRARAELAELQASLPSKRRDDLVAACTKNAVAMAMGHFGLAAVALGAQDGGNVTTTHNARAGIYARQSEHEAYETRAAYDPAHYHAHADYIQINREQTALKKSGAAYDYLTGERLAPNANADLDHVVSAKSIHDDRARVLAGVDGAELANTAENLHLTDSSLNRSKGALDADEWLARRDERLSALAPRHADGTLTPSEQNEWAKLTRQQDINDAELLRLHGENARRIDAAVDAAYYGSPAPYEQLVATGVADGAVMGAHFAIGLIMKEFIEQMGFEVRAMLREGAKVGISELFQRFVKTLGKIKASLAKKWKYIVENSVEAAIGAFFSNIVTFVVNIFFTTLKGVVRILRAGFCALVRAVRTLFDERVPKGERLYAAVKVLITGIIGGVALLGSEALKTALLAVPGLNVLLMMPIPFSHETIGDAVSVCLSAALGGVVSAFVIYKLDQFVSKRRETRALAQISAKRSEVTYHHTRQTMMVVGAGFEKLVADSREFSVQMSQTRAELSQGSKRVNDALAGFDAALNELENLLKGQK